MKKVDFLYWFKYLLIPMFFAHLTVYLCFVFCLWKFDVWTWLGGIDSWARAVLLILYPFVLLAGFAPLIKKKEA